jgi:alpha-L-fucosidase 2
MAAVPLFHACGGTGCAPGTTAAAAVAEVGSKTAMQLNAPAMAARSLRSAQPASDWPQALPIGNGRLGSMLFASISTERVQFNEKWCR